MEKVSRSVWPDVGWFGICLVVVMSVRTYLTRFSSLPAPHTISLDYPQLLVETAHVVDVEDQQEDDDKASAAAKAYLQPLVRNKDRTLDRNYDIVQTSENDLLNHAERVFQGIEVPRSLHNRRLVSASDVRVSHRSPSTLNQHQSEEEKNKAQLLRRLLTVPTTTCKRLVRVGGRSCLGAYDGSKLVCFDADVRLQPLRCLIYSFGVGNDFSFDERMQDFGCEVHSFDHDQDHENYDYRVGPFVFFHKARIGINNGYISYCERNSSLCEFPLRYQTMADIRRSLGHDTRRVNYLKMDIEGQEWKVIRQVLLHTHVLDTVSQLSLEVHLDDLRDTTLEGQRAAIADYLAVVRGLTALGFKLITYEENELNPQYETVDGVQLSLYAELLFIRRHYT
ncbi:Methyltransferase-like protein 24-like 8 [Homarus americanus]|uniref:Methyltransferase-like protein 24-like 8 n=1 Tax=Homarus americanus TaxID=6706 RepID=A0A8J5JM13_HOMAM|nr:Methyltransferase-like protein 24-like 8 [Homarus americanus]